MHRWHGRSSPVFIVSRCTAAFRLKMRDSKHETYRKSDVRAGTRGKPDAPFCGAALTGPSRWTQSWGVRYSRPISWLPRCAQRQRPCVRSDRLASAPHLVNPPFSWVSFKADRRPAVAHNGDKLFPTSAPQLATSRWTIQAGRTVRLYAVRGNWDRKRATKGPSFRVDCQPTRQGGRDQNPGWRESIGDGG